MVADAYFPETHATNDLVKALQQQVLSLERELGRSEDLQRSCHTIIRAMRTILEQHGIECPPLPDHMKDPDLH
jgi:hypothetical protein